METHFLEYVWKSWNDYIVDQNKVYERGVVAME